MDDNVTRHLSAELSRDDWDVLILHYLGLDHIGHLAGPASPLVPRKLSEMSRVMERVYSGLCGRSEVGEFVRVGSYSCGVVGPRVRVLPDHRQ